MMRCTWIAVVVLAMQSSLALAFCPMCKTVVEGASGSQELGGSLNLASLVLMTPPVILFAALFALFYRLRNASATQVAPADELDEPHALTD